MSFWDNHKDTFKAAGKKTATSIGHGTKALSKAGVQTYKKHEAERKGTTYVPPGTNTASMSASEQAAQEKGPYTPPPPPSLAKPIDKDKLASLPLPPKRNVGSHSVPQPGEQSAYAQQLAQYEEQKRQQAYQQPPQPAQPAQPAQPGYQNQGYQQAQPGYQNQGYQNQGYQPQPGYQNQGYQQPQPGYQQPQPGYQQPQPGYQPNQQPQQEYQAQPNQQQQQGYQQTQPGYQKQPGQSQPGYQNQPAYQPNQQTNPNQPQQGYQSTPSATPAYKPPGPEQSHPQNAAPLPPRPVPAAPQPSQPELTFESPYHQPQPEALFSRPKLASPPLQPIVPQPPQEQHQVQPQTQPSQPQPGQPPQPQPGQPPQPQPGQPPQYGQHPNDVQANGQPFQAPPTYTLPTSTYAQPGQAPYAQPNLPPREAEAPQLTPSPKPLPDPKSFPPPVVHKDRAALAAASRGASPSPASTPGASKTQLATPDTTGNKEAPAPPRKANFMEVDKTFAPPPKPYHGPGDAKASKPATPPRSTPSLPSKPAAAPRPELPTRGTNESQSTETSLVGTPVAPEPVSAPMKKLDISAFPPPPQIYRSPAEQQKKHERMHGRHRHEKEDAPPMPKRHGNDELSDDVPPPMPKRHGKDELSDEAPPMPKRHGKEELSDEAPPMPKRRELSDDAPPMPKRRELYDAPPMPARRQLGVSGKKAPPKPVKKSNAVFQEPESPPPDYSEVDQGHEGAASARAAAPNIPNFAEQIALRNRGTLEATIPTKPAKPEKPGKPEKPEKPAKPVKPAKPGKPEKPEKPGKPDKPVKPGVKTENENHGVVPIIKPKPIPPSAVKPVAPPIPKKAHHKEASPPPPPPSRSRVTSPAKVSPVETKNASPAPPPPPSRNYRTATPPVVKGPPDLDLELSTGWFANTNGLVLPASLAGLNYSMSSSCRTNFGVTSRELTLNLRMKDLAILRYKLRWTDDNVPGVKVDIAGWEPSPFTAKRPSKTELIQWHEHFGEHIAQWCEHREGKQVARGECWDLAHDALEKGCGKHALVSTYTHHGCPILELEGSARGVVQKSALDEVRRGDIVQYLLCTFRSDTTNRVSTAGEPDHTSVVLQNHGGSLTVAEQNIGGKRFVMKSELVLRDLREGSVTVYRPAPVEWAGSL